ncbi:hypothetical protein [Pleionea mediterranea]|uniref:hypothetical protein n=1 Tax=Pleionea mediterranea TaxID=523701 RepID=UPI0014735658|nr:hypothetical protein [Pleionea mediterranea]
MRSFTPLISALFGLFALTLQAHAQETVGIVYAKVREPYLSVFRQIVKGAETQQEYKVVSIELNKNYDVNQVVTELKTNNIKKVVTLGRTGYKIAKTLPRDFITVAGAIPISPNGLSGISLESDPEQLFDYLKITAPKVSNIYVAYSATNQWLIDIAEEKATEKGFVFQSKKVDSIAEAIAYYKNLFEQFNGNQHAIWLPLDKVTSSDKIILPFVLEGSWAKQMVIFSSKPSHASRGVLFSTYPDNVELGKKLLTMVSRLDNTKQSYVKPSNAISLAVNLRTAAHLGIKYSSDQEKSFELTFPE